MSSGAKLLIVMLVLINALLLFIINYLSKELSLYYKLYDKQSTHIGITENKINHAVDNIKNMRDKVSNAEFKSGCNACLCEMERVGLLDEM